MFLKRNIGILGRVCSFLGGFFGVLFDEVGGFGGNGAEDTFWHGLLALVEYWEEVIAF